jgi:peptide chain release factor 3
MSDLQVEINQAEINAAVTRRRTLAIISHPDAGKTTLTEKLLLYGGAIQEAGMVQNRRANRRQATSDWMAMEQQRGISITSTVLQFEYEGIHLNLLDTPGHQDFSEDTYRTLAAADNAVMLIDAAKGLEAQTRKLFEVCRLRLLPTFTFINKLDRPGRPPLELLDEIERELNLTPYAVNYPVGMGDDFQGVYDRRTKLVHLFERRLQGRRRVEETTIKLDDPHIEETIPHALLSQLKEDLEILDGAGPAFDLDAVLAGNMTPVFFGSAMTNFGVEPFLRAFLKYAALPAPHESSIGIIEPTYPEFSGFVFKLQANMDPRHRDCLAFVRVCSGKFTKDMTVTHARTNKQVRLTRSQKLFARERELIEEAYPGDVIGFNNPGVFTIGDTIYTGARLIYPGIPSFSPEVFANLRNPNPALGKKFQKGVAQLEEEGAVQILRPVDAATQEPILAAVGELQFEVAQFRLNSEYGVETRLEPLPYTTARWVADGWDALSEAGRLFEVFTAQDKWQRPVLLFRSAWHLRNVEENNPNLRLSPIAPALSF